MPTRDPMLSKFCRNIEQTIGLITTLNSGTVPEATTPLGLVVTLLAAVKQKVCDAMSGRATLTVRDVAEIRERIVLANGTINDMLAGIADQSTTATLKGCETLIVKAAAEFEDLHVTLTTTATTSRDDDDDPAAAHAIKRERPDDDDDPDADESGIIDRTRKPPRDRRQIDDDDEEADRRRREREAEQIGDPAPQRGGGWQCDPSPASVTSGTGAAPKPADFAVEA